MVTPSTLSSSSALHDLSYCPMFLPSAFLGKVPLRNKGQFSFFCSYDWHLHGKYVPLPGLGKHARIPWLQPPLGLLLRSASLLPCTAEHTICACAKVLTNYLVLSMLGGVPPKLPDHAFPASCQVSRPPTRQEPKSK